MTLAYTLSRLIFTERVELERNRAVPDQYGARKENKWEALSTVPGRLWWWKGSKSTDKSASAQYARPQATINVTGADLVVPLGTDVTDEDRVARVTSPSGEVLEQGPFRVLSVNPYETHIELSLERP